MNSNKSLTRNQRWFKLYQNTGQCVFFFICTYCHPITTVNKILVINQAFMKSRISSWRMFNSDDWWRRVCVYNEMLHQSLERPVNILYCEKKLERFRTVRSVFLQHLYIQRIAMVLYGISEQLKPGRKKSARNLSKHGDIKTCFDEVFNLLLRILSPS